MTNPTNHNSWESELRKEFQEWIDKQSWQGEDEFTKNVAVGNVADWWINKIKLWKNGKKSL